MPRTEIVPAYGMRPVGGFGIRGHRVHCECGYLSAVVSYRWAASLANTHRKEHPKEETPPGTDLSEALMGPFDGPPFIGRRRPAANLSSGAQASVRRSPAELRAVHALEEA